MDFDNESTFDEFTDTINNLELEKEKDLPALTCVDLFPDPPHLVSGDTIKAEEDGSLADEDDFPGFKSAELKSDENQNESTSDSMKITSDSQDDNTSPAEPLQNQQDQLKPAAITNLSMAIAPVSPNSYFSSAESVASSGCSSKKSKKRHCRRCDKSFRKTRDFHEHLKQHVTMPELRLEKLSDDHEKVKEYLSSINFKDTSNNGSLKLKLKCLSSQNFEVVPSPKTSPKPSPKLSPKPVQAEEARIRVLKASDIKCKPELNENTPPPDPTHQTMSPKLPNSFITPENKYFECPTFDGLDSFTEDINGTNEATDDLLKKLLENNKEQQQPFPREGEWPAVANEFISIDSLAPRCNVCNMNFSHPKYLFEHKQLTGHDFPNRMAPENHPVPNPQPAEMRHHGHNNYIQGVPPHPNQNMAPLYQMAQMRGNFHQGYGPRMNIRQIMHHHPQPSPPPGFHPSQCMMARTPPPLYRMNGNPVNYPPGHFMDKRSELYGPGPGHGPSPGHGAVPGPQFHNSANPQQHPHPHQQQIQHQLQQQHHQQQQQQQHHHQQQLQQQHQQQQQQNQQQHQSQHQQPPNADMMRQPIFLKSRLQKAIRGRAQGPSNESPTSPGILTEQTAIRPRFLGPSHPMPGQQMRFHRAPGPGPLRHPGEPPAKRMKSEQGPQFSSSTSSSPSGMVSPGISNSPGLPVIQSVHSGVSNFPAMNNEKPKAPPTANSVSPTPKGPTKNPKDVANILATRGITVTHKGKPANTPASNKGTNAANAAQEAVQKLQNNNSVSIIHKKKPIEINVTKVPGSGTESSGNRIPAKFLSCPVITCKEKFLTLEGVNRHAFRWHGIPMPNADRSQKRSVRCRECNHLCASPEILQEHMRREHDHGVNEIGIPIVDLRNDEVKRKLAGLGIFNYVPLTAAGASTSSLAFPVVSVQGASNPSICNLLGLGASSVLSLGPIKSIGVRKINNNDKK